MKKILGFLCIAALVFTLGAIIFPETLHACGLSIQHVIGNITTPGLMTAAAIPTMPQKTSSSNSLVLAKKSNVTQNSIAIGPKVKGDMAPVQSVGNVYDVGDAIQSSPMITSIDFTLDNSGGGVAKNYLIFDGFGFFAANSGASVNAPDSASSSVPAIKAMSQFSPMLISGFNYEVTVSTAQFQNALSHTFGDATGSSDKAPVLVNQAKRNNQFNSKLLTFEGAWYIDGFRGFFLTVNAGETVLLSFFIGAAYNRQ